MRFLPGILFLAVLLAACAPEPPAPYELEAPAQFAKLLLPAGNPMTEEGVALGRRLFYDPILSTDSSLSCASCHLPERAFTDGQAISQGIAGRKGSRNAPSLANAAYHYKGLFWDGRSPTLEAQALLPVENPDELGNDWETVEEALRRHAGYPQYFRAAFGIGDTAELTRELVARALAQFERTLISADAKYDRVMRGEDTFTPSEERGKHIFFDSAEELPNGECGHCHTPPLFTDQSYMNNGLDPASALTDFPDKGRGLDTGKRYDNGRFRVPSLRNVALTAPYMHDGRFQSLEEVIAHYNQGGHAAENVDPKIRKLHLSDRDKQDLRAFLETLTDTAFVNKPKYRTPF